METTLRVSRNGLIAILFGYQVLVLIKQFQGALEFYYFHLGLVSIVTILVLARDAFAGIAAAKTGNGNRRYLALLAVLLATTIASVGYLYLNIGEIELRQPFLEPWDLYAGIAVVACVLVLTYLIWGAILAAVIAFAIAYFVFGEYFPGNFNYTPPEIEIIVSYLAGMGGARGIIWGIPISANTLFLIIAFGGLLKGVRVLELFNELGRMLSNVSRGGICYSAILASTAVGMVTGQAVANIALSGSVTIPSMKQSGVSAERAGAVEVVASLGSQLIPPIMGLGGFLMAVNLGVPYADVATAAIMPALLFVIIIFISTYFVASTTPSLKVQKEVVDKKLILWIAPSFVISFLILLSLLYQRYSPGYSALWAIGLLVGLAFLRPKQYRPSLRQIWDGLVHGVISASHLAIILAGIGIVVQVLVTTGAGFDLGRMTMYVAGDEMFIALLLGMVISLLVGLGLPTPAAYALIAIIMVPFLIDLGVAPLVAHFFGFYFAIFSAVTPPVAVGVMAATKISEASFYGTALEAAKMSLIAILIPFSFVAFPSILEFPAIGVDGFLVSIALIIATVCWGATVYGFFQRPLTRLERLILLLVPLCFIALLGTGELYFAAATILAGATFIFWNFLIVRQRVRLNS